MGLFDDLIPQQNSAGAGLFDDLIPSAGALPEGPPTDIAPQVGGGENSYLGNLGRGIGERAAKLAGGGVRFVGQTADSLADWLEQRVPLGQVSVGADGINWRPTSQEDLKRESPLLPVARGMEGASLGYTPRTTWEDVKAAPLSSVLPFAFEQGVVSAPDMAAVMLNLPAYVGARTGEIGQDRAGNNGQADATVGDFLAAAPAAVGSALLERLGMRYLLGHGAPVRSLGGVPAAAGRAAAQEGATEAGQEFIEYAGETLGTKKRWSGYEALDRAAAGAVGGAPFGGAARTISGTTQALTSRTTRHPTEAAPPNVTAADVGSPIPTDLISEGRSIMAGEGASPSPGPLVPDGAVPAGLLLGEEATPPAAAPALAQDMAPAAERPAAPVAPPGSVTAPEPASAMAAPVAAEALTRQDAKPVPELAPEPAPPVLPPAAPTAATDPAAPLVTAALPAPSTSPEPAAMPHDVAIAAAAGEATPGRWSQQIPADEQQAIAARLGISADDLVRALDGVDRQDGAARPTAAPLSPPEPSPTPDAAPPTEAAAPPPEPVSAGRYDLTRAAADEAMRGRWLHRIPVGEQQDIAAGFGLAVDEFARALDDAGYRADEGAQAVEPVAPSAPVAANRADANRAFVAAGFKAVSPFRSATPHEWVGTLQGDDGSALQANIRATGNPSRYTLRLSVRFSGGVTGASLGEIGSFDTPAASLAAFTREAEARGWPRKEKASVAAPEGGGRSSASASTRPILNRGRPFETEASAALAVRANPALRGRGLAPVKVDGGWGLAAQTSPDEPLSGLSGPAHAPSPRPAAKRFGKSSTLQDVDQHSSPAPSSHDDAVAPVFTAGPERDSLAVEKPVQPLSSGGDDDGVHARLRDHLSAGPGGTGASLPRLHDAAGHLEGAHPADRGGSEPDAGGVDGQRAEMAGRPAEAALAAGSRGSRVGGDAGLSRRRGTVAAGAGSHEGGGGEQASRLSAERSPGPASPAIQGENHIIAPGGLREGRGWKQKARDNIAAIELIRQLEAEGRPATAGEQERLALYVGWGGLKNAFPDQDGAFGAGFGEIGERLRSLLTDTEYATARRSIQYAHYTAETVVRAMWDAARRLGFRGGKVFEPGMGTGNFAGMMPADLASATDYAGLELDHTTARIARALYPRWGVRRDDFTRAPVPKDTFDLVIGNPPFADVAVKADPVYAKHGFLLHDYFFAKSLDAVRPGGVLLFVTSAGTMNKVDTAARGYLADRADLVAAVRLPGNAFERNAGTSVTTDIVILRKRLPGEEQGGRAWVETVPVRLPGPDGAPMDGRVNRYFADHPEMVLGEQGFFDKLYAGRYAVRAPKGFDLEASLRAALDRLQENILSPWQDGQQRAEIDFATAERKEGAFYLGRDGRLMQVRAGTGQPVERRGKGVEGGRTSAEIERITGLVPIRDALRAVFAADLEENEANATTARRRLNEAYGRFVERFGPINKAEITYRRPTALQQETARAMAREDARYAGLPFDEGDFDPTAMLERDASLADIARARTAAREGAAREGRAFREGSFDPADMPDAEIDRRPNIDPFMDDPESHRLRAIEHYDPSTGTAKKGDLFLRSVIRRETVPDIRSVDDAVLFVLNRRGRLDMAEVAAVARLTEEAAVEQLGDRVFREPGSGVWVTRDAYLSGNVRRKLRVAQAAAERNPAFRRNVEALEATQPAPLPPSEISAHLGMPWLPPETVEAFGKTALGLGDLRVRYTPALAQWLVSGEDSSAAARSVWGTPDRAAPALLADALNRQDPRVYREGRGADGKKTRTLDPAATEAAQDKLRAIKDRFFDWVWEDKGRAEELASLYNDIYNNLVVRDYDGSYLTTPGVASSWGWRPHQTRVIARIIQAGNTYMAHGVGAGKTSAMIGAGMEMRRLGLVRKPMYVVPNHMLGQFTREFYEQYPTARIKVADERAFHTSRRRQFVADMASEDLDAVIITHSAFGMIPVSDSFQDGLLQEQIDVYRRLLEEVPNDQDSRITRSRIEKQVERLEQRLVGKGKKKTDQVFTFEETGVDFLFVDEAHLFRKLDFATRMAEVKGISPEGSKASWDLWVKTRYLETVNPGRNLVLASGTPVTNTMAELFTVSRFLQPQELKERGLEAFDAWAGAFGDTVTALEQDPAGGYKPTTRFAKFVNVPELSAMVRQVMDVVTSRQLGAYVTRPALKGGRRTMNLAPKSEALAAYQENLAARMRVIAARKGPPEPGDDILLKVINDGRHAAIDMRLVDPSLPADPNSKLNLLIDNVHDIWKRTKRQRFHHPAPGGGYAAEVADIGPATQMIFANLGLSDARGFSVPRAIVQELTRRGVPRREIALIQDYDSHLAKQRLFNHMNEGKVRILIGSTAKMATGVNAQRRLYALHNLDPLWYPADDEQRNGRIIRQGNTNPEVEIHDYSTKGTYDSTMWGLMETKARFIQGFFEGDATLRDMDDLGEASVYEQAKAISTADERLMTLTDLRQRLEKARRRRTAHDREMYALKDRVATARRRVERLNRRIAAIGQDIARRQDIAGDAFRAEAGGRAFTDRVAFGDAVLGALDLLETEQVARSGETVGRVGGFELVADATPNGSKTTISLYLRRSDGFESEITVSGSARGLVQSIEATLRGFEVERETARADLEAATQTIADYEPHLDQPFTGQEDIDRLSAAVRDLESELARETRAEEGRLQVAFGGRRGEGEPALRLSPAFDRSLDGIAGDLRARLERIGIEDRIDLKLVDAIRTRRDRVLEDGEVIPAGTEIPGAAGRYVDRVIEVALASPDRLQTLGHEVVHALRDLGVLRPLEWRVLTRAVEDDGLLLARLRRDYAGLNLSDEALTEEAVAEMFGDWLAGQSAPNSFARRAFERIRDFFQALGNALRGYGFTTPEMVFRAIERGDVGRRSRVEEAGGREEEAFQAAGDPVSAVLTGDELGSGLSVADLRKAARMMLAGWSASKLTVTNAATGMEIGFDRASSGKAPARIGENLLRLIPAVPDMLRTGRLWQTIPGDRPGVSHAHIFTAAAVLDGRRIDTILYVHEKNTGERFYSLHVDRGTVGRLGAFPGVASEEAVDPLGVGDRPASENIDPEVPDAKRGNQGMDAVGEHPAAPADGRLNARGLDALADEESAPGRGDVKPDDDGKFSLRPSEPDPTDPRQPGSADARKGLMLRLLESQPIDRALRAPFDVFGGTDGTKSWNPGKHLFPKAAQALTSARFSTEGPMAWMNPVLHKARAGLVDRYGLDPSYVERDRQRGLEERRITAQVPDLLRSLADQGVSPQEMATLHAVLSGDAVPDARWITIALPIREAIDQMGAEAVELGLLSPEAFERNRGKYLHRVYLKHEADMGGLSRWASHMLTRRRRKILGDQFKGRGMFLEAEPSRLFAGVEDSWDGVIDPNRAGPPVGTRVRVLEKHAKPDGEQQPDGAPPTVLHRAFALDDRYRAEDYQGYTHQGTWEVRGTRGGKVVLWRDFTKEERIQMGEIVDARYTIAKTYMLMAHDLSTGRFFRDIAANAEWSRGVEPPDGMWRDASDYNRYWADESVAWVRVPDTMIPKSRTRRYGALSGRWVRAEIWRDMAELERLNKPIFWDTVVRAWKLNKTARNPVVHMNNIMSNVVFMDLADVRAADLARAVHALVKEDAVYREAVDNGAFGADMVAAEIRRDVLQPLLDEMARNDRGGTGGLEATFGIAGKLADRLFAGVKAADRAMLNAYQMEDEVFRMALYLRRREQGLGAEQAALEARDHFIDYDIRAPWVNLARRTALPFIAYTYRAVPVIAKAIAHRPWKLAKYATMAYAFKALSYAFLGLDDDDEDKERRSLREEEQGYTWIGTERMLRLPMNDEHGNPMFLDIRRWIPGGDIFDLNQGQSAIPIPAFLQPGGPLAIAAELYLNRQSFTGQDITNPLTDDAGNRAGAVGGYLWKAWMPSAAWIPGSWYWDRIGDAINGVREPYTDRPYSLPQAVASSMGIKVKPQDVEAGFTRWALAFRREEKALEREAFLLARDRDRGAITQRVFESEMARVMEKRAKAATRMREVFGR